MALQPAAGAKDLNPRQVESNRKLSERLASVFRLWGYDEVSPPRVERLDTLMAEVPSPVRTWYGWLLMSPWGSARR